MADMSWDELVSEAGDEYNLPPEGEYQAIIEKTEATVSKVKENGKGGNPMIVVSLKISEGPQHGKGPKKHYVTKSAAAAGLFLGNMKAVGVTVDDLKKYNPTMDQVARYMVGKRVTIKIKYDKYNGNDQAVVDYTMKPPRDGATACEGFPQAAETPVGAAAGGSTIDPGF
jgi:hypothetical protein